MVTIDEGAWAALRPVSRSNTNILLSESHSNAQTGNPVDKDTHPTDTLDQTGGADSDTVLLRVTDGVAAVTLNRTGH